MSNGTRANVAVKRQIKAEVAVDLGVERNRRFGGVAKLYGDAAFRRFQHATVVVVGLGGVGSWAAEALARSAIGHLVLIDLS